MKFLAEAGVGLAGCCAIIAVGALAARRWAKILGVDREQKHRRKGSKGL